MQTSGTTTLNDDAIDACRSVIEVHSKSFSLASRLLPPGVREEAWVVYAWCRRADDAVDESPPSDRERALSQLQAELDGVYRQARLREPVLDAFQAVVQRRAIPRSYPSDLLEGMAMDVRGVRYEGIEELLSYCYRVAGTVGLMMCHVMGVSRQEALANAAHMGMAMQLTNICRDVLEDWHNGRLYLPASWLAEEGAGWLASTTPGGELPAVAHPAVARVVARLLKEADVHYASGDHGLDALSWRCALAVRMARSAYADIGDVIRTRGYRVWDGRASVPGWRKAALLAGSLWHSLT